MPIILILLLLNIKYLYTYFVPIPSILSLLHFCITLLYHYMSRIYIFISYIFRANCINFLITILLHLYIIIYLVFICLIYVNYINLNTSILLSYYIIILIYIKQLVIYMSILQSIISHLYILKFCHRCIIILVHQNYALEKQLYKDCF